MLYIWRLRSVCWGCWLVILGLILVTHWLRKETPGELGFRVAGLGHSLAAVARPLLVVAAGLLAAGAASGALGGLTAAQVGLSLVRYLAWGLFQQYVLNGYFVNRLQVLFGSSEKGCAAAAAVLFGAAHAPNGFLMAVSLGAGYACARMYLRFRNLYQLGILHAVVGCVLHLVVPGAISHDFVVGPGYFER